MEKTKPDEALSGRPSVERGPVIQIAPPFRILVAIEAIDGRKYAPSIDMRSWSADAPRNRNLRGFGRRITGLRFGSKQIE